MTAPTGKPPEPSAQILRFPRKRGRPKSTRPQIDTGTPELIMKRLLGCTTEALDLCLERGIISRRQHWCGIHLRWLFTLRHGVPGVRAVDPTHLGGCELKPEDPTWRDAREKEYNEALCALSKCGHVLQVMNICVYNERPKFLDMRTHLGDASNAITRLREGLDVLVKLWG